MFKNIPNFPGKLPYRDKQVLMLDPTRLLVSLRKPFDLRKPHARRSAFEHMARQLRGTGLQLEEEHYGGAAAGRRPRESVNHTDRRFWVRSDTRGSITRRSFQALSRKRFLEWFAPVYRLPGIRGRRGVVCPLPDVLLIPTRLVRETVGCTQEEVPTRLRSYGLDQVRDAYDAIPCEVEKGYGAYRVAKPRRMNSYAVRNNLSLRQKAWGKLASFALMPMLDPVARFPQDPPNDPRYQEFQWNLQRIGAERGWTITRGDPAVVIAVIDEGCDFQHPEFGRPNRISVLVPGASYYANGAKLDQEIGDSQVAPSQSHGTECAGIIGAAIDNAITIAGLAPDCRLLPIRLAGGKTSVALAYAIKFAVTNRTSPAKVISISLASQSYNSHEVREAIELAHRSGVVVCCASGNANGGALDYPAAYAIHGLVIACGACNRSDARCSSFEDWGEGFGSNFGKGLSVVAPGEGIPTLTNDDGRVGGNWISNFAGTSAAAPHVAALAGLLLSVKPTLSPNVVREIIETTAEPLPQYRYDNNGWNEEVGHGIINVEKALQEALNR